MIVDHDTEEQRFNTSLDGHDAVLDYQLDRGVMTITHTGVPPAIEGRGVAAELMRAALAAARSAGWTVNPACSYAAAYMRRHRDEAGTQEAGTQEPGTQEAGTAHRENLLDEALEESFPASDSPSVGGSS